MYGIPYCARHQHHRGAAATSSIPDPHSRAGGDAGGGQAIFHLVAVQYTQRHLVCTTSILHSLMRTTEGKSKDLEVSETPSQCKKNIIYNILIT